MPAIINTNIASLNAQRNLNSSQSALQTSLQRLSSGLRINSAKDDAAGLAISERFSTQIRGLNQAARNANDGISLAQTGEGALAAVTDNLQRIRELAVQAANSTNSADDRAALQLEVAQRLAEIDRTATQTSFNGQKLLDGSFTAAAFQIGANAGETISVEGLGTGVRLSATGQIAQATSGVIASAATNGRIAVTPTGTLNFGTAGSAATAGTTGSIALSGLNFGTAGQAAVAGTNASTTTGVLDFTTAASAQVDASVVVGGGGMTAFDYSGAGLAQFNVNIAGSATTTVGVTLNQAYADGAAVASAIQTQIRATAGNEAVTVGFAGGNITITNTGKTGAGNAVTLSGQDVNASAATHDFDVTAPSNGSAATAGTTSTFTVTNGTGNGVAITLNGVYADQDAVAAAIQAQFALDADTAAMTASNVGGVITFTNVGSPTAVAISASNQAAINAGFVSDAGTAGNATVTTTNAQFTVDAGGKTINLTQNYADQAALLADIQTQIGAQGGGLTVSAVDATHIKFDRTTTGVASTAVSVALGAGQAGVNAGTAGVAVAPGTAGANAVTTTNATFYVDGNAVTLNANYADQGAVATAIGTQLAAAGYTAAFAGGDITIQKTGSLAAVSITGADTNATAAGFGFNTNGTAGSASGSVTLAAGAFTVAGTAVAAGTYASVAALATYVNANATGVYASEGTGVDAGKLVITSSAALTLGGTAATTTLGFAATSFAANSGTLTTASVVDAASANTTIQRIDAALTSVSNLRSTFGAVQNRFESVISSLSATSENLTAARSRIQDTDFAAETAQLTRNQILQQAGTAMLAQANQLPNTVLSLLR